ncbi:MAG TPA: response regulator [Fimbriimonadaceae bacterium]|nr:response regulator [Fimbriimonadaceae bacterium]HRJ32590.1 response regulator [Fimbriimonadaceae bacterium]
MARLRILIADDDPIIVLDLRQMLESLGYEVVGQAGDGQEAVELASETRPDVCVMDVKMPGLDGIDAASAILGENIAPVVLLTAYSDRELIERASQAGVFGYLVKPFKPNDLPPAIEIARSRFEQNQRLNQEIAQVEERLEARKVIDRAKGLLMDRERISEAEAYRRLQTTAMQDRKTIRDVAQSLIESL